MINILLYFSLIISNLPHLSSTFDILTLNQAKILGGEAAGPCQSPDLFILVDRKYIDESNAPDTIQPLLSLLANAIAKCNNVRGSLIEYGSEMKVVFDLPTTNLPDSLRQSLTHYTVSGGPASDAYLGSALENVIIQVFSMDN